MDEGLHWFQKKATPIVCERIKRAGFNVLIPAIWHGRGTTWPSGLSPWDSVLAAPPSYDPVENLLKVAESFDLEVHPWFTVGLRQRDFFPEYAIPTAQGDFDWHNPAFRDFIVKLMLEVAKRYPIHGLNLDFVRFGWPIPGAEVEREAVVADVIRRTYHGAKAINKHLVISADVAPWHPTITQFGQNGPKWADEGIIDVMYSMQYQWAPDFDIIRQIQSKMKRPETVVVMIGNFDEVKTEETVVPRAPNRVVELITQSREISSHNGVAMYDYSKLNDLQITALKNSVFQKSALPYWKLDYEPPAMPKFFKVE